MTDRDRSRRSSLDQELPFVVESLRMARARGACPSPLSGALLDRLAIHTWHPAEAGVPDPEVRAAEEHLEDCVFCFNAFSEFVAVHESLDLAAPFIGRTGELQELQAWFDTASEIGRGVACVVGEPGIGKSRLLREFVRRLRSQAVCAVTVSCTADDRLLPYGLVIQILSELCDLPPMAPRDLVISRLESCLRESRLDPGYLPYLLQVLAIRQDLGPIRNTEPDTLKFRIGTALTRFMQTRGQEGPVVLVVDDIAWADPSSFDCLKIVHDTLGHGQVFQVFAHRPDYRVPWLRDELTRVIHLGRFNDEDSRALCRSLWPGGAISREMVRRADGNPFFLEELLRNTRERGGAEKVPTAPEKVSEVVLDRVARLRDDTRDVLETASVIGRDVSVRLLSSVTRRSADECLGALAALRQADFLTIATDRGEPVYRFRHALIQEVLYAARPEAQRRRTHVAIAVAVEAEHAEHREAAAEILAHHFARGHENNKAVDYAILAAEKVQRRAANREALDLLISAVDRLEHMADNPANRRRRVDAVLKQREARFALGQQREHIENLRAIGPLVEEVRDPRTTADWHYSLGFLEGLTGGSLTAAVTHCQTASQIADMAGLTEVYARAECCLTQLHTMAGDLHSAVAAAERALAIFERESRDDSVFWTCRTLWQLCAAQLAQGRWEEALANGRVALDLGASIEDRRLMAVAWFRLGAGHMQRGDWAMGLTACWQARALSPFPFDEAIISIVEGYGIARAGRPGDGLASLRRGLKWFEQAKLRYSSLLGETWMADALLHAGARPDASELAGAVAVTCRGLGYRHLEAIATRIVAEGLIDANPDEAIRRLAHAEVTLEEIGAVNELAKVWVAQAEVWRRRGEPERCRALLERALRIFEELGTIDEPARVRAILQSLEGGPHA